MKNELQINVKIVFKKIYNYYVDVYGWEIMMCRKVGR